MRERRLLERGHRATDDYGGLQLTQENWEKYGGLDYATSADLASRSQQIAVAEKVLADQGVGVWATCGLLHNLGGDSGSADVDTGVADDLSNSDSSSGSSGSPDSSDFGRLGRLGRVVGFHRIERIERIDRHGRLRRFG